MREITKPTSYATRSESSSNAWARRRRQGADIDYVAFEERFRGSSEDLTRSQQEYLKFFPPPDEPGLVVDVGCGRGEMVEVLTGAGHEAVGIDLDEGMVAVASAKGLAIEKAGALGWLEGKPDESLKGIFCAQVVEHLLTSELQRFIALAHQKLRTGGVLITETINPRSLHALEQPLLRRHVARQARAPGDHAVPVPERRFLQGEPRASLQAPYGRRARRRARRHVARCPPGLARGGVRRPGLRDRRHEVKPRAVHQFHSGAAAGDAITQQMLHLQTHLRAMGYESEVYAEHIAAGVSDLVRPIGSYRGDPEQLLFVHHSMGYDAFGDVVALPDRMVLVYHNITPEHLLAGAITRFYARMGRRQLEILVGRCHAAVADSNHNREELLEAGFRRATVLPVRTDYADFHHPTWLPAHRSTDWLFVGRLVPSKCQIQLVEAFAHFARRQPLARLALVGDVSDNDYVAEVVTTANDLGVGDRLVLTGKILEHRLVHMFHRAGLYVSLSEHEGFGVPLLEAMAAEVPVIAYRAGAVAETMAGAGILLDSKEPDEVAALATVLLDDDDLRQRLLARQLRRVRQVEAIDVKATLRTVIEEACTGHRPLTVQVQGPFETSYSLAVLNRRLAVELARQPGLDVSIYATEGPGDYTPDLRRPRPAPRCDRALPSL